MAETNANETENEELTLEFVKDFLHADTEDDEQYIKFLMRFARRYVIGEIGHCDQSDERVQGLMLGVIATMYEKRLLTLDKKDSVQYTFNTIIMQLQMEAGNHASESRGTE